MPRSCIEMIFVGICLQPDDCGFLFFLFPYAVLFEVFCAV